MDLVGPGDIEHHFEDSIGAVSPLSLTGSWIDLGSGAGFPGIALAVYHPHIQVTLVESRQKRALFLKRVLSEANLHNATLFHGRTEDIVHQFDGVISRAYKPPANFLQDADRLTPLTGRAVCLLGSNSSFEPTAPWVVTKDFLYPVANGKRKILLLEKR